MNNFIHTELMKRPTVAASGLLKFMGIINFKKISDIVDTKIHSDKAQASLPLEGMIKATFLSSFFELSDKALERELQIRADFGIFCGMYLNEDFPDHKTLRKFRNEIVAKGLLEDVFNEFNAQLDALNLEVDNGRIVILDATAI